MITLLDVAELVASVLAADAVVVLVVPVVP